MRDSKLGPEHKAAFLRAMQRFSLEQSAEEAVNVNPESENVGRHACPACGTANRRENSGARRGSFGDDFCMGRGGPANPQIITEKRRFFQENQP